MKPEQLRFAGRSAYTPLEGEQLTPFFGSVVVESAKLQNYCLSDTHPRERHKARVFLSGQDVLRLTSCHVL